jgi:hypothetical protein
MALSIDSRKKAEQTLVKLYPGARIIDVTSKAPNEFVRFSPFIRTVAFPFPIRPDKRRSRSKGSGKG